MTKEELNEHIRNYLRENLTIRINHDYIGWGDDRGIRVSLQLEGEEILLSGERVMSNVLIEGRFVVCAACRYGTLVIAGARHYDKVMQSQLTYIQEDSLYDFEESGRAEQGFIDQFGVFMDRKEALAVATAAGQINVRRSKTFPEDELFSEDLY